MKQRKAKLKTVKNNGSVEEYLESITNKKRLKDCKKIDQILRKVTGQKPTMWGKAIVGYGEFTYVSPKTGRTGDWLAIGWSNRVQQITVYFMNGFKDYGEYLDKIGKHTLSKSCLYIKSLDDIDLKVLEEMATISYKTVTSGKTFE